MCYVLFSIKFVVYICKYKILLMSDLSEIVKKLSVKLEKMMDLHNLVKEENSNLKQEKENLLSRIEILNKEKQDLVERNNLLKLAKSLSQTNEKSSNLKTKINELVREIDKSIALLNR